MDDVTDDLKYLMEEDYLSTSDKFILHVAIGEIDKLEAQRKQLLEALNHLVNTIPVPEIELARSAWGNTNVACVLEAREKAVQALAAAKGQDDD